MSQNYNFPTGQEAAPQQATTQTQPPAGQTQSGNTQQYAATGQQFQPQYQQPAFGAENPFAQINVFDLSISRNSSNQVLSKLHSELKEHADSFMSQYNNVELELLILNRDDEPSINISAVVLTMRTKGGNGKFSPAVFYPYLLEATADDLTSTNSIVVGGLPIEDRQYASNAYDKEFVAAAHALIVQRSAFTRNGVAPIFAEATLIPRIADLENEEETGRMLTNGLLACRTVLQMNSDNWTDFRIPVLQNGQQLHLRSKVKVDRRQAHRRDYMSLPVRNDITIALETNIHQPQQQQFYGQQPQKKVNNTILGHVTAFMDMVYVGRGNNPMGMGFGQAWQPPYALTCVITSLESNQLTTINGQGMVLASAFSLYQDNIALSALNPIPGKKDDMHNIGTLNIESNVVANPDGMNQQVAMMGLAQQRGVEVDVQSANFNEVSQYMAMLFNPRFSLAFDVSECGADTWLNSVFVAAALGNKDANQAIFDSWNIMTEGKFGSNLTAMNLMGQPFFTSAGRILMGHYTNPEGQLRDIRDFDHLAMQTILGRNDPLAVQRWTNARHNLGLAENVRFHEQRTLIQHAAQTDEVNFTGLAHRLNVNMNVMTALSKALSECNLRISAANSNNLDMSQRFIPTVMNQFDPQMLTGTLFAPQFNNNSMGNNMPLFGGRWMQ